MARKKLIQQLKARNPELNQSEIESIIDIFFDGITESLKKGENIEIRGLGRWQLKKLKENHSARNPATNKLIYVPERVKVKFKASKKLNKIINE